MAFPIKGNAIPQATTAERNAEFTSVANGFVFYNTDTSRYEYTIDGGASWLQVANLADVPVLSGVHAGSDILIAGPPLLITFAARADTNYSVTATYTSSNFNNFSQGHDIVVFNKTISSFNVFCPNEADFAPYNGFDWILVPYS